MALTASIDTGEPSIRVEPSRARGGSNDAFSFWKPSQDWKAALDYEIAESKAVAQHYLFEEYLSRKDRRPPSQMQAYYRIKSLIPGGVRHRLNSAAIKMRAKREFPRWPCEGALIDYWRDWLRISLHTLKMSDAWHVG